MIILFICCFVAVSFLSYVFLVCSHTGCRVAVPSNPGAGLTRQDAVIFDWDAVGNEGVNPSRHAAFQGTSSMAALATRGVRVLVK